MATSKLFIIWSGDRSKAVAKQLHEFIGDVLQDYQPFMSDSDLTPGKIWPTELHDATRSSDAGLVIVTPENKLSPYLHYEVGGLVMRQGSETVVPALLVGISKADLAPPLGLLQLSSAEHRDEVLRIFRTLNDRLVSPLEADRLERSFNRVWPELEVTLQDAAKVATPRSPQRGDDDKLDELLSLVREIATAPLKILTQPSEPTRILPPARVTFGDLRQVIRCASGSTVVGSIETGLTVLADAELSNEASSAIEALARLTGVQIVVDQQSWVSPPGP